jgi:hypothetical protein
MSKWQIICPLALLTVVGLLVAMVHGRHHHRYYVTAQTGMVGQELIAATNSPRLVNVDQAFTRSLSMFLASPARVSNVQLGDDPPLFGDGTACSRLTLTNAAGRPLRVRLGLTPTFECFRIVSYWDGSAPGPVSGSPWAEMTAPDELKRK